MDAEKVAYSAAPLAGRKRCMQDLLRDAWHTTTPTKPQAAGQVAHKHDGL